MSRVPRGVFLKAALLPLLVLVFFLFELLLLQFGEAPLVFCDASLFESQIALGLPIIVGVQTLDWEHWGKVVTEHAVVVVGIDRENGLVYINDPYFAEAPIEMSLIAFEIGWQEKERQYAVIGLAPP